MCLSRKFSSIACTMLIGLSYLSVPVSADANDPRIVSREALEQGALIGMSETVRLRMLDTISEKRAQKRSAPNRAHKASDASRFLTSPNLNSHGQHPVFDVDAMTVQLDVSFNQDPTELVRMMEEHGAKVEVVLEEQGRLLVRCPRAGLTEMLNQVDQMPGVEHVRPVMRPSASTGSVLSQGDAAHRADLARQSFGVDGSGASVCVISTGIGGLGASQASGDAPINVEVCPFESGELAEGTAMLEIVHDLAPGANLAYCSGGAEVATTAAIEYLANDAFGGAGCDVIVDDLFDLFEPFFQDGIAAQAIDKAVANGSVYFTSAGNNALSHYEAIYRDVSPGTEPGDEFGSDLHDWGVANAEDSDVTWQGLVGGTNFAPNNAFFAVLQWNDPIGASKNDYDILIFDQNGRAAGDPEGQFPNGINGTRTQDGDDDPVEFAAIINETPEILPFYMVVDRDSGSPRRLEIGINPNFAFSVNVPGENYAVDFGSVVGHSAARSAFSIGATGAVNNIDGTANPRLNIIEPFSARGFSIISFNPDSAPQFEVRAKPDFVAADGVSVTGNGGFPDVFYGTSAAAPHAAAIAALVIDAADRPLSRTELRNVLAAGAKRRSPFATWGFGFIDASNSVRLARYLGYYYRGFSLNNH